MCCITRTSQVLPLRRPPTSSSAVTNVRSASVPPTRIAQGRRFVWPGTSLGLPRLVPRIRSGRSHKACSDGNASLLSVSAVVVSGLCGRPISPSELNTAATGITRNTSTGGDETDSVSWDVGVFSGWRRCCGNDGDYALWPGTVHMLFSMLRLTERDRFLVFPENRPQR